MPVQLETRITRYRGLSTDPKPGVDRESVGKPVQRPPVGSVFVETDTGDRYVWAGSGAWVRQEQTIEGVLETLTDMGLQIVQLLEDIKRGHEAHLWGEEVEPE